MARVEIMCCFLLCLVLLVKADLHCSTLASVATGDQCLQTHLPDCRGSEELSTCPEYPSPIFSSKPDTYAFCSDYEGLIRQDCSIEETELNADLNISIVPHSSSDANITVSWQHLNLTIAPGSRIELKLFPSPCTYCAHNSPFFYLCVERYWCTSNISETSALLYGVPYQGSNAIQLAIVTQSGSTSTVIRTKFAERQEDFTCTNTAIMTYNPHKCPPPRYGLVQNMSSSWRDSGDNNNTLELSWLVPAEHQIYHVAHHYHLLLEQAPTTHIFSISSDDVRPDGSLAVSIGPLEPVHYFASVRVKVHCCEQCPCTWLNFTIDGLQTNTPPGTPTTTPPGTITTTTLTTTPTTTPLPESPVLLSVLVPLVVVLSLVITIATILLLAMCCKRWHTDMRSIQDAVQRSQDPVQMKAPSFKYGSSTPQPTELQLEADSNYVHFPNAIFTSPQPQQEDAASETTQCLSSSLEPPPSLTCSTDVTTPTASGGEVPPDQHQSSSPILPSPNTIAKPEDSILVRTNPPLPPHLGESKKFKVLIVYSLDSPEQNDIRQFVAALSSYAGIEPICYDLVCMRFRYFKWLLDNIPGKDAVLCVCTERFKQDWESQSDYTQALKNAMHTQQGHEGHYSNFASVIRSEGHRNYIPDTLQLNCYFTMDNIPPIVAYIKKIPLCVLRSSTDS